MRYIMCQVCLLLTAYLPLFGRVPLPEDYPFKKAVSGAIWEMESKFGVTQKDAKPGTDKALAAAARFLKANPTKVLILQYGAGTYNFQGKEDSFLLPGDLSAGPKGRLIIQGEGMRKTKFVTVNPSATAITGRGIKRIMFKGIHFARTYYTVTQGTVVSTDLEGGKIILELHKGFPTPKELFTIAGKRLQQGNYLRKYTDDLDNPLVIEENNPQIHWDPNKTVCVDGRKWAFGGLSKGRLKQAQYKKGDILGVKCKHGGQTYRFMGGDDIVFEDCLWTHQSRGVLRSGISNIRFSRCRVERLPKLFGRTPCLATPGGGPQLGQPKDARVRNVIVEDCMFDSSGDDNVAFFNVDGGIIRNTYTANAFARSILLHKCTETKLVNNKVVNGKIGQ